MVCMNCFARLRDVSLKCDLKYINRIQNARSRLQSIIKISSFHFDQGTVTRSDQLSVPKLVHSLRFLGLMQISDSCIHSANVSPANCKYESLNRCDNFLF